MKFNIYIESEDGKYPTLNEGWTALEGWRNRGTEPILFQDIEEVPRRKTSIVIASINTTIKQFERLDIEVPPAINIPQEIESFADREINRKYTLGDFRKRSWTWPLFIKGAGRAKVFYPEIVKSDEQKDLVAKDISDEEPILISTVKDFISEWRVYVVKGEIQGLFNYSGDMFSFPHISTIMDCIAQYKSAPAGYGIDFGITRYNSAMLIEVNDGWSLGNYGLEANKYIKLLSARWLEIIAETN